MQSELNKMAHPLAGRPLVDHCILNLRAAGADPIVAVVGQNRGQLLLHSSEIDGCVLVDQSMPLGTGDAARRALEAVSTDVVFISVADAPLLRPENARAMVARVASGDALLVVATAIVDDPGQLGRIVRRDGRAVAIVESSDLADDQREIREINAGMYAVGLEWLRSALGRLEEHGNGQYLLTDILEFAVEDQAKTTTLELTRDEAFGIDTRVALAQAETIMRRRINERHMLAGVTVVDPATTYIDDRVEIGADTTLYPNTTLEGRTVIGRHCRIGPNTIVRSSGISDRCEIDASVIEDSTLDEQVDVGPFSHLRRGAVIGPRVHVGNFAEIKNSSLGADTKMGHFGYLGDAILGERVNVGAGTVTCNYDGKDHHQTHIGNDVFIGSDTMLVAPISLGDGTSTGAGSVVTRDVAPNESVRGVPAKSNESTRDESS